MYEYSSVKGKFNYAGNICLFLLLGVSLYNLYTSTTHSEPRQMEDSLQVPCSTDKECEELQLRGFKCGDNMCTCEEKSKCQTSDIKHFVRKLGQNCTDTSQCNISQSFCNSDGVCACINNTISSENHRKCLNVTAELGRYCEENAQCSPVNGLCTDGKCKCNPNAHIKEGVCYNNTALGASCHSDVDCSNTEFSECNNGFCICKKKYVQSATNSSACLLKARKLLSECSEDTQCKRGLGSGSVCSGGSCICTDLYHYKANTNKCVNDLLLGEVCGNHSECHQPGSGESRLECILGICKCKPPYAETEGYCISSTSGSGVGKMWFGFTDVLPFVFTYVICYTIVL